MSTRVKPKNATDEANVKKFHKTSNLISGTSIQLENHLKQLGTELKADKKGLREYEVYRTKLELEKAELEERIRKNKEWIVNAEARSSGGGVSAQYGVLLDKMNEIYNSAKEFHAQGIEMLMKDFDYHLAYKRWDDTFTAVPFKPK